MQGFFTQEELEDKIQIEFDFDEGPNCQQCGLFRKCNSSKMKYTGQGKLGVLIIGEVPEYEDDQVGAQFIDTAGQLLVQELKILKLDLDRDFWKTNSLACRPSTPKGANRPPTKAEIKYCKPLVDKTIKELNPKMIWLMGTAAVESMYQNRFSGLAINRWRKLCIPDRKTGAYIIPLFHPSYINRNDRDENLKAVFKADLKWAVNQIKRPKFTFTDEREDVHCIYDFNEITQTLGALLAVANKQEVCLYIDYETNALKPQWPGTKIATISFSTDYNETAVAFPYQYSDYFTPEQQDKIKILWIKICLHKNIYFAAHNLKFEDGWTRQIFGIQPRNWEWDTMIAAHIQDNRSKYCGLKFQSYINFGLEPYNKEVDKYLKASSGHFNKVDQAPLPELLLYNGLDTKMGMKLWQKQKEYFAGVDKQDPNNKLMDAYNLFHDGILAFSDIQQNGICIDEEYYKEQDKILKDKIGAIRAELKDSDEAKLFLQEQGKDLDLGSSKDLGVLFYDVLQLPAQTTKNNNYRVDVDALDSIKIPFVDKLLQMRKWEKASGTYMAQLLREVCGGRIYPMYDLHIPISGRGSSSMPNWQNIPSHDPEIGPIIRSGIFPTNGNCLVEIDYSSIEVRIAALVTLDENLLAYVLNPEKDMHMDVSMDIWMLPKDEVTKEIRFHSKGGFTFSQFYGSYYVNCAKDLWKHVDCETKSGTILKDHMQDRNINNLNEFTEHCKGVEEIFWGTRFKQYAQWKIDINELYRKQGYIDNLFGFRFVGYLSEKQCTNFPVQSSAFHVLLDSLIRINNIAKEEKWKSKIVGQIHDSALLDIFPEEQDHVLKTCVYEMSENSRLLHPFITIPIPVEVEISPQNLSWWDKKEVKI
jgi:uracil-DNA glycosylase